jgi:hypothetical protein
MHSTIYNMCVLTDCNQRMWTVTRVCPFFANQTINLRGMTFDYFGRIEKGILGDRFYLARVYIFKLVYICYSTNLTEIYSQNKTCVVICSWSNRNMPLLNVLCIIYVLIINIRCIRLYTIVIFVCRVR